MVKLKLGYKLVVEDLDNSGCTNGNYPYYTIYNAKNEIVKEGMTCRCGRGCSQTDCVRDDWNFHDTDIEEFREEEA